MVEELFKQLAWKCQLNGFHFNSQPPGIINIFSIEDNDYTIISRGYIANYRWETPEEVLERMNEEVDLRIKKTDKAAT
ncbi:hypothetical protein [Carnobacterium jeotgali]|uniref:hypothetical protein n=1 Tax=Carnobacterium jeotgali TaxID=545534 RepID=UPI000492EBD8|nr:hypothetical protein [Carnobacterium jeotgali]